MDEDLLRKELNVRRMLVGVLCERLVHEKKIIEDLKKELGD